MTPEKGSRRRFGHCPKCDSPMRVKKVRVKGEFVVVRVRLCKKCGCRVKTIEHRPHWDTDQENSA